MNHSSLSRTSQAAAFCQASLDDAGCHGANKAGLEPSIASTFAKISAPENEHLFSAEAATKAFAHVRVES